MKKPSAKQLNLLAGQANWSTNLQLAAGTSQAVTSFFTGKVSGGSDTNVGVIASAPHNKVFLRVAGTGQPIKDATSGTSVFARLTESSGAWTLSFFKLVNGTEVAFDTTGHEIVGQMINFRYCEVRQYANYQPTSIVYAGEGIDEYDASSAASHQHIQETLSIATDEQTIFTLSQTPKDGNDVALAINGIHYINGTDFTVSATTLTWTSVEFSLETTDKLVADYAYVG
jgi:hypothetical protein